MNDFFDWIARIEKEHKGIRVLYLAEAGSRAYGFDSSDSDHDITGFYVQPLSNYLNLWGVQDNFAIESFTSDAKRVSFRMWDFAKVLRLVERSNPGVLEALYSPIVYYVAPDRTMVDLKTHMKDSITPARLGHHYASMLHNQVKDLVNVKNVLYAVRCALSLEHLREFPNKMPPVSLKEQLEGVNNAAELKGDIWNLVKFKREKGGTARMDIPQSVKDLIEVWAEQGHEFAQRLPKDPRPSRKFLQNIFSQAVLTS